MFALALGAFGGIGAAVATTTTTKVATTNYVDNRITKNDDGDVQIKNESGRTVTLQNDPANLATAVDYSQQNGTTETVKKTVTTIKWIDDNRTSKVRSGSENSTTLVNMWIGD